MPIPKPNKGEDRNAFMNRCMSNSIMKSEYPKRDQRVAICSSSFKKKRGESMDTKKLKVEFVTDIHAEEVKSESGETEEAFFINGTAVEETVSRNKVFYPAEELKKAAKTLDGVPLLKDHKNSVDSVVGRVSEAKFDNGKVLFKAKVVDKEMQEKIREGLVNNVSIGSELETPFKTKVVNGVKAIVAKGIEFLELSLVAIPGIPTATFAQAVTESYKGEQMEEFEQLKKELEELKAWKKEQEAETEPEAEPEVDTPEETPEAEPEEEEEDKDDGEEALKVVNRELATLKRNLSNITKELAKSKSKPAKVVESNPWSIGEIKQDNVGWTQEWNYEYWQNHPYRTSENYMEALK